MLGGSCVAISRVTSTLNRVASRVTIRIRRSGCL